MLIVFDVGGTLIQYDGVSLDWAPHYRPALLYALSQVGVVVDADRLEIAEEILYFYNTRKNPRRFEIGSGEVVAGLSRLLEVPAVPFEQGFFGYFHRKACPLPGAGEVLDHLRKAGACLAGLSDVPYGMPTSMLMDDLGQLASRLHFILSSCDIGFRKPSARGLQHILALSGQSLRCAYYVGDELKDIEAANAAGFQSILLAHSSSIPDYGQTNTIHALEDVIQIVC